MANLPYTIPQVIDIAKICQYLGVYYTTLNQFFKGGDLDVKYAQLLYMERTGLEYQYNFNPNNEQLQPAANYIYNLCGRYLSQALQILGTGSGIIIIPGTGAGGTLRAIQLEWVVGQAGSYMSAGATTIVLNYNNVVGGSVNVFQNNILVSQNLEDRVSYTIVYTDTTVTITFNQAVQDTELYNITFLQLIGTSGGGAGNATTPYITTTAITSITDTTAVSGGKSVADGGDTITARGVCWNTTGTPTTSDSHTSNGTGTTDYSSSLTGLTASTTYYVRAYATNSIGTTYGDELTFDTTAPALVVELSTVSGSNYTANKGTNQNIVYVLKVENFSATTYNFITVIAATLLGQAISTDVAASGIKVWRNTTPNLSGSPTPIQQFSPSGTTSDSFSATSLSISLTASSILYIVFSLDIDAAATTGRTLNFNGATNPVVLTITGSPTQTNSQSNISPIITVGT